MKKNFLQDVIPASQKRSIRDIPLPSHRNASVPKTTTNQEPLRRPLPKSEPVPVMRVEEKHIPEVIAEDYSIESKEQVFDPQNLQTSDYSEQTVDKEQKPPAQKPPFRPRQQSGSGFIKKIVVTAVIAVLLFGGFMLSRTQAKVVIYPKQGAYEVDVTIPTDVSSVAVKTQITKSSSVTLQATSEQQVEKQATGRIKITNYHAEKTQELVKNTRFQTPEGLIYQIRDSIEIPGYTVQGGTTIPGTLEVDVYASSAGEEYNIGKTKFTIPGFQGKEQFTKITAESLTDMTGGYIGIKKVVSEDAQDEAEEQLRDQLTAQFTPEPSESETNLILPDIDTIRFGELNDSVEGNSVTLSLTATSDAYSFKKQDLFNFLGQNTIVEATTSDMFLMDSKSLNFEIEDDQISVKGSTDITWITDVEALKNDIAGKKRSETLNIIDTYNSFEKTDIQLKPFWKTKFPSDPSKIDVEIAE